MKPPSSPRGVQGIQGAHGALTLDDLKGQPQKNRRAEERIARERPIVILPCTTQPDWDFKTVLLSDCSPHGLAIIARERMKRGDEFLAKVKIQRMTMVVYRVCHCQALPDGRYRIGAKLVECVGTPDEILAALLAQDAADSTQ